MIVASYTYGSNSLHPTAVTFGAATISAVVHNVDGGLKGFSAGSVRLASAETTWNLAGEQLIRTYELESNGDDLFVWDVSSRDEHGNILLAEESVFGQSLAFAYDAQDRLDSSSRSAGGAVPTNLRGYQECELAYDGSGNRLSDTCFERITLNTSLVAGSSKLYSVDWQTEVAACGIEQTASAELLPDARGRTTQYWLGRHPGSVSAALEYGHFGYLDTADVSNDGVGGYSYFYDHASLRRRKVDPTTGDVIEFDYDRAGRLISERTDNGVSFTYREYVYVAGEPVLVVTDDGTTVSTFVLANDHLATPRRAYAYTDGTLAWAADLEPFGRAHEYGAAGGAAVVRVPLRFPGQYQDDETGLHYNWNRYYDPDTGRYVSPDPLGRAGGDPTLYAYAGGNPLSLTDPTGLDVYIWVWAPDQDERHPVGHVAVGTTAYQGATNVRTDDVRVASWRPSDPFAGGVNLYYDYYDRISLSDVAGYQDNHGAMQRPADGVLRLDTNWYFDEALWEKITRGIATGVFDAQNFNCADATQLESLVGPAEEEKLGQRFSTPNALFEALRRLPNAEVIVDPGKLSRRKVTIWDALRAR